MLSIAIALLVLIACMLLWGLLRMAGEHSRAEEEEEWQRYLTERRTRSKRD